jgi:hypothetical protein
VDWTPLSLRLAGEDRPLLIVSDSPSGALAELGAPPGAAVVVAADESAYGHEAALRLCAALRRRRRRVPVRAG